jgi:hypothetical protein
MEAEGFKVQSIYLQSFWRDPLDVLRTILWTQGVDEVPAETIARALWGREIRARIKRHICFMQVYPLILIE